MTTKLDKIILLGGGGHAGVLIELIRMSTRYEIVGILDLQLEVGALISGVSVLGKDYLLPELYTEGVKNVCIGVGSIKDNSKRKKLYERVKEVGFSVPRMIHSKSIVSKNDVEISEGVQIMMGGIIQSNTTIDANTIVNTGAIIEHDCNIGKHVHICPGTVISGGCVISDNSFIGAGATVIQGVKIGKDVIVAAGAIILDDVPDNSMVKGVAAR